MKTIEQKRAEAEDRREAYQALTPLGKLNRLDDRGEPARRERDRIWAQINKEAGR